MSSLLDALRRFAPVITLCLAVAAWQLASTLLQLPAYLLPAPTAIVGAGAKNWALLLQHATPTMTTVLEGFALSVIVGIPLAIAIIYSSVAARTLYPLIIGSYAIPKVAIAPLFIVWFGFGELPKVLIAFFISFFPVVIDTVVGLESVDPDMLQLVRSMGGSTWQSFTKVRFPHAMPSIFGGLKIASTLSVVGAVVGEFVGSNAGLGYLVLVASGNLNGPVVYLAVIMLAALGLAFFYTLHFIERRVTSWHLSPSVDQIARATM